MRERRPHYDRRHTLPWRRRFNLYRRDWAAIRAALLVLAILAVAYSLAALIDQRQDARDAQHTARAQQQQQERVLVALLNEQPVVDTISSMTIVARVESYP